MGDLNLAQASGHEKLIASLVPPTLTLDDVMLMVEEDLEAMITIEAATRLATEGSASKISQSSIVPSSVMHQESGGDDVHSEEGNEIVLLTLTCLLCLHPHL